MSKQQFPLYNNLSKDIPKKDLKASEKNEFIKNINNLDQNGYDLIYVLIKAYHLDYNENKYSMYTIPYGGKFIKNDLHFDLEKIPIKLKHILYKFVILHTETMVS